MPPCHLAASAAATGDAAADAAALCAATAFKAASLALCCWSASASRILAPGRRTLRSEIWTPFCHGNFFCDLGGQRSRVERRLCTGV